MTPIVLGIAAAFASIVFKQHCTVSDNNCVVDVMGLVAVQFARYVLRWSTPYCARPRLQGQKVGYVTD